MSLRFVLLNLTVCLLFTSPAMAAGKSSEEIREKEKAARKACMVGKYEKGLDILSDLFIATGDANHIFNQARCLQQNHRWQEAVDRFQEFLRKVKNLSPTEASETDRYIAECERHLSKSAPAAVPAPLAPPAPVTAAAPESVIAPAPAPDPAVSPVEAVSAAPTAPATKEDRGGGLRLAGIITGGLGLAGIGAGVYCSVKTYSLRDDPDRLNTTKTWGIVSYAVGGAALAAGTTMLVVGMIRRGSDSGSSVAIVAGPGTGTLLVQGRF